MEQCSIVRGQRMDALPSYISPAGGRKKLPNAVCDNLHKHTPDQPPSLCSPVGGSCGFCCRRCSSSLVALLLLCEAGVKRVVVRTWGGAVVVVTNDLFFSEKYFRYLAK